MRLLTLTEIAGPFGKVGCSMGVFCCPATPPYATAEHLGPDLRNGVPDDGADGEEGGDVLRPDEEGGDPPALQQPVKLPGRGGESGTERAGGGGHVQGIK